MACNFIVNKEAIFGPFARLWWPFERLLTEIAPMTLKKGSKNVNLPREIIILTQGDIWDYDFVFDYVSWNIGDKWVHIIEIGKYHKFKQM